MITTDKVIKLFFLADTFCMLFDIMTARYTLRNTGKRSCHQDSSLSKVEIMLSSYFFMIHDL